MIVCYYSGTIADFVADLGVSYFIIETDSVQFQLYSRRKKSI